MSILNAHGVMPRLAFIFLLASLNLSASAQALTREEAVADLDTLQSVLERYAAYLSVNHYDYASHLDSLEAALPLSVSVVDLGLAVRDLIGQLQDAHSRASFEDEGKEEEDKALPFPLVVHDGRVVAATALCDLLDPDHPYLEALNGVPLEKLLHISGARHRGHSPQRFLTRATDNLEDIGFVLKQAGAFHSDSLIVTLTDSVRDTTLSMMIAERQPWRLCQSPLVGATTVLPGGLAYLKIEQMWEDDAPGEDVHFEMVRAAMESRDFAESRGMIIDVRGNTGGTRDLLHYLLPFFITEPLVYNAAVVRHDTVGLAQRGLFAVSDERRDLATRQAAEAFAATFEPLWDYPQDAFLGGLFVAVVDERTTPYDYSNRPVVVLMDAWSFSATDIFLAAMGELPHVTLMGTASAGGSGRSRTFRLPHSGIEVRLSTMASFQPNGQLYDGYGVEPDVTVPQTLRDALGQSDSQLVAAIRLLRERTHDDEESGR